MGYIITPVEVLAILKESEKYGGHPCTKHIGLSNEQLMARLYNGDGARDGGIQYVSTFTTERDAATAASQTFKNIDGGIFEAIKKHSKHEPGFTDVRTDQTFKVRFALGGGVKEYYSNHMTLVLFTISTRKDNHFYIKTFYPRPPNELRLSPKQGNT